MGEVRLDAMAKAKEDALAFSQQTLEEDAKKFEDYLQALGRPAQSFPSSVYVQYLCVE